MSGGAYVAKNAPRDAPTDRCFFKHMQKGGKNGQKRAFGQADRHFVRREKGEAARTCAGKESGLFMANGYEMMDYLLSK